MRKRRRLAVAPHNWGSLVGFYMMLHVGRAVTNFYRAENDPLETDILTAGLPANAALVKRLMEQWRKGWKGAVPPGSGVRAPKPPRDAV